MKPPTTGQLASPANANQVAHPKEAVQESVLILLVIPPSGCPATAAALDR